MKVVDQQIWSEQDREIKQSGDIGTSFLTFLTTWANQTEEYVEDNIYPFESAFRNALVETEASLGTVPLYMIGQMLVLLTSHWQYKEQLADILTPIEHKLLVLMLNEKLRELQEEAEQESVQVED